MREALLLLTLIVLYNFLLYYATVNDLTPVPLFPEDPVNAILVVSFNAVLYVGWLFGERRKLVTLLGYLFFFQITLLALVYRDPYTFVSSLLPVILTFMFVALVESPFERSQRKLVEERERLLKELDELARERSAVEEKVREFKRSVELLRLQLEEKERQLEQARRAQESEEELKRREEEVKRFREKLKALEEELRKQRDKELKLMEANRKLFQMLELLGKEEDRKGGKELKTLRKERKKLIKEVLELQELLELYEQENRELKERLEQTRERVYELEKSLEEERLKAKQLEGAQKRREKIYEEVLSLVLPSVSFSKEALKDLLSLDRTLKKRALAELRRLPNAKPEPITTAKNLYKLKFSGGRLYLRRTDNGGWEVAGILDSEDDADKARVIERLREG
ncbi:MAG: hypothetical protein GXO03_00285 [Aquificae bacterium]|nr:hypothetical protein [Aquificota bacterium]